MSKRKIKKQKSFLRPVHFQAILLLILWLLLKEFSYKYVIILISILLATIFNVAATKGLLIFLK